MNAKVMWRVVSLRETQKRLKEIAYVERTAATRKAELALKQHDQRTLVGEQALLQAAENADRHEWLMAEHLLRALRLHRERLHDEQVTAEKAQRIAREDLRAASVRAEQAAALSLTARHALELVSQRREQALQDDRFAARRHHERRMLACVSDP